MQQHQGIWLPDGEKHILEHLDKGPMVNGKGTYQYPKLQLALKHTQGRRRAVDIGAHVGLWAMHLIPRFELTHCFEPVSAHRQCFLRNIEGVNGLWELEPVALGKEQGEVTMIRHHGDSGDTWVKPPQGITGGLTRTETVFEDDRVEIRLLDSFDLQNVDFIKVDCEGYELYALQGAEKTIKKWKPTICVEQKPGRAAKYGLQQTDALPYLESLGMKQKAVISGDYIMGW